VKRLTQQLREKRRGLDFLYHPKGGGWRDWGEGVEGKRGLKVKGLVEDLVGVWDCN